MNFRLPLIGAVAVAAFVGVALATMAPRPATEAAPLHRPRDVKGALQVVSPVEYQVDSRRVRLCGVRFAKPAAVSSLAADVIRSRYEGRMARCHPVGANTPCDQGDYRSPPEFVLAQCFLDGGIDLAAELLRQGMVCGTSRQTVLTYAKCKDE